MPTPNLPPGFDFTDPDMYAERLPIDELAHMRKVAPIWWQEQERGNLAFGDTGYWVVTKHKDVKEVSRRSDVFSSNRKTALPRYRDEADPDVAGGGQGRAAQPGRPASHPPAQDHLARIHPARHRVTARRAPRAGPQHRQGGRGGGIRRFRRAGVVRASAAGDRRPDGCAAGGPQEAVRLVESDGRRPGPGIRQERPDGRIGRTDHVRHADGGRAGQEPRRRPRHQAGAGRRRRPQAHRRRVRLLRDPAGGGGQRDHPQLDHPGHDGVHRIPGPVGAFQAGAARDRRRRDRPLGNAGHLLPAHRARGHRAGRRARSRRTSGW